MCVCVCVCVCVCDGPLCLKGLSERLLDHTLYTHLQYAEIVLTVYMGIYSVPFLKYCEACYCMGLSI